MVQRRPELFAAYVGTGQVGSWRANVRAQFDFMLAKSRAANDRKKVELMEAIGTPDPTRREAIFFVVENAQPLPDAHGRQMVCRPEADDSKRPLIHRGVLASLG